MLKRAVLYIVTFTMLGSLLHAHYTHYPFSSSWQEAEQLQTTLNAKFGGEKPFADYLATVYTLMIVQERLERHWFINKDEKVKNLLAYSEELLVHLEQASHEYSLELAPASAPSDTAPITAPSEEGTSAKQAATKQAAISFFSILQAAQKFLDEHAPLYLDPNKQREQGQQPIQFVPQPTWPPTYPWPPQGPYPQQPQQPQPPQQPNKDEAKWETIAKVVGAIAGVGFVYYVFNKYFQGPLVQELHDQRKVVDALVTKQGTHEAFVTQVETRIGTAKEALKSADAEWTQKLKLSVGNDEAVVNREIQAAVERMTKLAATNDTGIEEVRKKHLELMALKSAIDVELKRHNAEMNTLVKSIQKHTEPMVPFTDNHPLVSRVKKLKDNVKELNAKL